MIQYLNNQQWLANNVKSYFNLQNESCNIDYQHWSSDPRVVREAFYESSQQNKMENSNSIVLSKRMYESIFCDKDKIIHKLKKRLISYIGCKEMNMLQESNEKKKNINCMDNIEDTLCNNVNVVCNNSNILPTKEVYESLSNDQDTTIRGLSECLKNYISNSELNLLLNLDSCDYDDPCDYSKISSMVTYVSKNMKNIAVKLCNLLKSNTKCVQKERTNCFEGTNERSIKNINNQIYPSTSKDCNAEGDSASSINMETCEVQFKVQDINVDCCNETTTLLNQLSEMTQVQDQILVKFNSNEVSNRNLLLEMRKANAKITRENRFSDFGLFSCL